MKTSHFFTRINYRNSSRYNWIIFFFFFLKCNGIITFQEFLPPLTLPFTHRDCVLYLDNPLHLTSPGLISYIVFFVVLSVFFQMAFIQLRLLVCCLWSSHHMSEPLDTQRFHKPGKFGTPVVSLFYLYVWFFLFFIYLHKHDIK